MRMQIYTAGMIQYVTKIWIKKEGICNYIAETAA